MLRRDAFDNAQSSATTWTGEREDAGLIIGYTGRAVLVGCFGVEKFPDPGDIGGAVTIAQEAVMADAVLAFWQHVDEKPPHELMGVEGHGFMPCGTVDPIILDAECDATLAHLDQTAVGDGHAVCVSAQIGQDSLGSCKGSFGVDHPIDFTQRLEEGLEGSPVGKVCVPAVELQPSGFVQFDQPFQDETPIQT